MASRRYPLSPDDVKRRAPLWAALADLFLDTEMEPWNYKLVREAALAGGFGADDVKAVLLDEIAPVFGFNIIDVAGEWAGFDPESVTERVSNYLAGKGMKGKLGGPLLAFVRHTIIRHEWPRLERVLAGEDIDQAMAAEPRQQVTARTGSKHLVWGIASALLVIALVSYLLR